MTTTNANACIECGKQRVIIESHTEDSGNGTIVYSETACPDPECQKRVDVTLFRELEKRKESMKTNRFRAGARKAIRANQKIIKAQTA